MPEHIQICDNPSDFSEQEIMTTLMVLDNHYHNSGDALVTDEQYDHLYFYAKKSYPTNTYFLGIGSDVRGEKVKLPIPMTGLSQVQIGDIKKWKEKNNLENQDDHAIISDKLDGVSAMLVYDANGKLQIAYSRGNGTEGADITRHIRKMPSAPKKVSEGMIVRGEVIIPRDEFETARDLCPRDGGELYKNARNMVAGIMNSKTPPIDEVYKHIHFVAYGMPGSEERKEKQINTLRYVNSFKTAFYVNWAFYNVTDENLSINLDFRRKRSNYEIDGLVIEVEGAEKRKELSDGSTSLEPAYAVKYKVADASNVAIATVIGISWKISKHGYIKPTVLIEPVELVGVTIQRASGYNAKFITENVIGPGAKIKITRAGDVIPDILGVVEPSPFGTFSSMPNIPWEWNETKVDIVSIDRTDEEHLLKLKSFFNALQVKNLQEASIVKLIEFGHDTIEKIIKSPVEDWLSLIGVNGVKAHTSLHEKLMNISHWELMGAYPYFYRGFGQTRAKLITDTFNNNYQILSVEDVLTIPGFDTKTAQKFIDKLIDYMWFVEDLDRAGMIKFKIEIPVEAKQSHITGLKFVFTGFRDKAAEEQIVSMGGILQDGIKKDTDYLVAKDITKNSGNLIKARDRGIQVIGSYELNNLLKEQSCLVVKI